MRTQPTPNVNPTIDDSQALLSGCWWLISLKQALGQVESPWVEPTYFQFTRQATNYASQFPTDKQSRMDGSSTSPIASLDNQKLPLFKDMNWLPVIDYENMNIICVYWCVCIYIYVLPSYLQFPIIWPPFRWPPIHFPHPVPAPADPGDGCWWVG